MRLEFFRSQKLDHQNEQQEISEQQQDRGNHPLVEEKQNQGHGK